MLETWQPEIQEQAGRVSRRPQVIEHLSLLEQAGLDSQHLDFDDDRIKADEIRAIVLGQPMPLVDDWKRHLRHEWHLPKLQLDGERGDDNVLAEAAADDAVH